MGLVVVLFVVQFYPICMYVSGGSNHGGQKRAVKSFGAGVMGACETPDIGRYWDTNSEVSRSASTMV